MSAIDDDALRLSDECDNCGKMFAHCDCQDEDERDPHECPVCGGSGGGPECFKCPRCNGSGAIRIERDDEADMDRYDALRDRRKDDDGPTCKADWYEDDRL